MPIMRDCLIPSFIRAFLRLDDTAAEATKAQVNCNWLMDNFNTVSRLMKFGGRKSGTAEVAILAIIHDAFWDSRHCDDWSVMKPGATLTFEMLREVWGHVGCQIPGTCDALEEMEADEGDTEYMSPADLDVAVALMARSNEEATLEYFGKGVVHILKGMRVNDAKGLPYEPGAEGAKQFIYDQLEKGLTSKFINRDTAFLVNEDQDTLVSNYRHEENQHHTIGSGIPEMDEAVQMKRGHLVGVLGYNKHRKTTLCRSMVYHMLQQGLNVLWITYEQTYLEELEAFQIMHCHRMFPHSTVSANRLNRHLLTETELEQLTTAGLALENLTGKLKVVEPGNRAWETLKTRVEMEQINTKNDVLVVDYLTLISPDSRDKRQGMEEIIMDAKQLAKSQNLLFLTPVQGNRAGADRAAETGWPEGQATHPNTVDMGQWDKEGIDTYSEFNKSCDAVFSIYYDDGLKAMKHAIIGLLFCRRADVMRPVWASVNNEAGWIYTNTTEDTEWNG